ncbi:DUF2167 domain-containing protein [Patiriisocius marinus]|uniref:DUF2167 domain-containing protein n=1 Tax=Patiriisocius marinus TaxID=1397112 RepID=UPI002330DECC|nr:DUF2167 domain-containing protein [Patiriisocius marinus]
MKIIKTVVLLSLMFFSSNLLIAQDDVLDELAGDDIEISEEDLEEYGAFMKYADSIDKTFDYKYGEVILEGGMATLNVPENYKFLDKPQANRVLTELWGNPEDDTTLGMLIKEGDTPISVDYGIEISYSPDGYIEDDDAKDMDYDDLLEEMQQDTRDVNPERERLGYGTMELVGWASKPFYDEAKKKLHWAKEIHFDGEETNTLNYNIRVLGRKGYINLNVIGDMEYLEDVQENLAPILSSVKFTNGNTYADFDPDMDDIAAYGIGGLIAGKVLAKAGFFALILKFWKFIAIGAVAAFAGVKKFFFKKEEEEVAVVRSNRDELPQETEPKP